METRTTPTLKHDEGLELLSKEFQYPGAYLAVMCDRDAARAKARSEGRNQECARCSGNGYCASGRGCWACQSSGFSKPAKAAANVRQDRPRGDRIMKPEIILSTAQQVLDQAWEVFNQAEDRWFREPESQRTSLIVDAFDNGAKVAVALFQAEQAVSRAQETLAYLRGDGEPGHGSGGYFQVEQGCVCPHCAPETSKVDDA